MTTQILTRSGWTTIVNARTVSFDFQSGTTVIEGEIDGKVRQISLPLKQVRHSR